MSMIKVCCKFNQAINPKQMHRLLLKWLHYHVKSWLN